MNDCKKQKKNDPEINCLSSDFQNITRNVLNYTEKNEAIIKLGFEIEDRMTISCKNSLNYFLQSSNVMKDMDECMKNHSKNDQYYLAIDENQSEQLSSKNNENVYTVN